MLRQSGISVRDGCSAVQQRGIAAHGFEVGEAIRELAGTFEQLLVPDVDVAHAAGWKDTRAMKLSYQQADPATVLRVVELEG